MDSTQIREQLRNNVPPDMREAYDKVVVAGMKFMFDEKTHQYAIEALQGDGDPAEKLGKGVAQLMGILAERSQGAFPEHLIIPAGIELVMHAAEFAQESGMMELTPDTLGNAIQIFVFSVFEMAGMGQEQVMQAISNMEQMGQQGGQEPEMPEQEMAAQPDGLINRGV